MGFISEVVYLYVYTYICLIIFIVRFFSQLFKEDMWSLQPRAQKVSRDSGAWVLSFKLFRIHILEEYLGLEGSAKKTKKDLQEQ